MSLLALPTTATDIHPHTNNDRTWRGESHAHWDLGGKPKRIWIDDNTLLGTPTWEPSSHNDAPLSKQRALSIATNVLVELGFTPSDWETTGIVLRRYQDTSWWYYIVENVDTNSLFKLSNVDPATLSDDELKEMVSERKQLDIVVLLSGKTVLPKDIKSEQKPNNALQSIAAPGAAQTER